MKNCPALRINSQEKVETKEHVPLSPSEWEGPGSKYASYPLPLPLPFPPLPLSRDYLALRSVRGYNDIPWSNSEIRWNKPSVESQWSLCPQGLRGGGEGEEESWLLCTI